MTGRRLAGRITFAYVLLIAAVAVVLGTYLAVTLRAALLAQVQERLTAEARLVAVSAAGAIRAGDTDRASELSRVLARATGARVTLVALDGRVLGDSDAEAASLGNHASRPEVAAVLAGNVSGANARHSASVERELFYLGVPVNVDGQMIGVARVARDVAGVEADVRRVVGAVLVTLGATALVAALVAWAIAWRTARRVTRLTGAAHAIAQGDLSRRIPDVRQGGGDEIDELGRAFDEMTTRVRDLVSSLSIDRGRLSAVLAAMDDGVLLVDGEERVILLNRAAIELVAVDVRAIDAESGRLRVPRKLIELVPDHELYALARQSLHRRRPIRDLVRHGPTGRHLHIGATPMNGGVLLLVQDVTEIRRAETIRRDFAANVSHELKTPIAALKALVETLEDGALDDPPAARDFLSRMHVEVDELAQLVQELLDLARIESGRAQMTFAPCDAGELVDSAANRLRAQAQRANVELSVGQAPNLPPVRADAARVESALINLLHNAIKFTPPGGRISVRAEAMEADGRPFVKLLVEDTGVGIPADDLPRLFERFYKADRSRSSSGTGLGLAIVKHIVQAHGGQVGAHSEVGKGSTFWFTLALAETPAAPNLRSHA